MADEEFTAIKDELIRYAEKVPERIAQDPGSVAINKDSLFAIVSSSSIMQKLDAEIAHIVSAVIEPVDDERLESDTEKLNFLGINTVAELEHALESEADNIIKFARVWIKGPYEALGAGISLLYLYYVIIGKTHNLSIAKNFVDKFQYGMPKQRASIPNNILSTYRLITGI